IAQLVFAIAQ
ncbi:hypothetical protein A2U01_0108611, partial [Trifolium medium]|nr:hypothetical protein [Trifolium medium]